VTRLALAGVACARGGRSLFAGVSLALGAGDAAVVTGANGAGKSTLLRVAAGLLAPVAGVVERDGSVALLSEAAALDAERTLRDALGWWAGVDGTAGRIAAALTATGLADLAEVPVRWLSTGQRRRAGMARVLVQDADIWLLDEPANGLDTGSVAVLEGIVADRRAGGGIVVVATHLPLAMPGAMQVAL